MATESAQTNGSTATETAQAPVTPAPTGGSTQSHDEVRVPKAQYEAFLLKMPGKVDWDRAAAYDNGTDNTVGM